VIESDIASPSTKIPPRMAKPIGFDSPPKAAIIRPNALMRVIPFITAIPAVAKDVLPTTKPRAIARKIY
jgi:hypothetical protein